MWFDQTNILINTKNNQISAKPWHIFITDIIRLENDADSIERSFCECDKELGEKLQNATIVASFENYDTIECQKRPFAVTDPECCRHDEGYFTLFNGNNHCCEDGIVRPLGHCFN